MVPMNTMSDNKRRYFSSDMQDWVRLWRAVMKQDGRDAQEVEEIIQVNWPDVFPIRSVVPLRIALLDPKTIDCICKCLLPVCSFH